MARMHRTLGFLSILLCAGLLGGWVIKETKSNTDLSLQTSPSGTPAEALKISGTTGAVTVGPTAALTSTFHVVNGSIVGQAQAGVGSIGGSNSMNLMSNLYYDTAGAKAISTQTGYTQARTLRSSTSGGEVFQLFANYQDAQTANSSAVGTNELKIIAGTAAGTWTLGVTGVGGGIKLPLGTPATLDRYEAASFSPSAAASTNMTGSPTITKQWYSVVGKTVFYQFKVTGLSVTASSTRTVMTFNVPVATTSSGDPKGGSCLGTQTNENVGIAEDNSGTTAAACVWPSFTATGAVTVIVTGSYAIL